MFMGLAVMKKKVLSWEMESGKGKKLEVLLFEMISRPMKCQETCGALTIYNTSGHNYSFPIDLETVSL